jgi:DNA helicase-2/ATP-dependent DNA helicase PcrA
MQWEFPRFDSVFIDEDQDLNPINHLTLAALNHSGARIVGVGDRYQAIYGFRGALSDSIPRLVHQFGMLELPLSTTYRCAEAITFLARSFCPDIQSRQGAPIGMIGRVDQDPNLFPPDQLILCRTNAPLFRAILRHVRARVPCQVLSNFLQTFQSWIRRFKAGSIAELKLKAEAWYWKEHEAANVKGLKGKMAGLSDRYQTLLALCQDARSPEDIVQLLKRLADSRSGPIFSTIHKAKGLEAQSVYLLRPDLCPAPWDLSKEAQTQERNLQYVAITRAKEVLTFGPGLDGEAVDWAEA